MNINQIRYFETVLKEGSFSAAARAQYVTVQAVSKSIADLERELGQDLFIRENRCVRPTEFGLAFHAKALPALQAFKVLEEFAGQYEADAQQRSFRLLLCAPVFHNYEVVVPNIASLLGRALDVSVDMRLATVDDGLDSLKSGQADAIVTIGRCDCEGVECVKVGTMGTAIAVKSTHPLASRESVRIEDLGPYPVVAAKEFDDFNESILTLYRVNGLKSPLMHVSREDVDFSMEWFLSERDGYVFCAGIPALFKDVDDIVMLPFAEEDAETVPLCVNTLKGKENLPFYKALVRFVSNPAVLMALGQQ